MCQISEITIGSAGATGVKIVFSPILKTSIKLSMKNCII